MAGEPRTLPSGTVTFLFTDVEGSTGLLERLGRERYAEALERHRDLLRGAVEAGGTVVDVQGDGLLAVFAGAGDAVRAAVSAQRALAAERWPEGAEMRVRMGLHTGEATAAGDAYVGLAVHRGRRVCEAAHGGQVVLSSATRAVVEQELPAGVTLRDLGEARLAGFERPERLAQVEAEGLAASFPPPRAAGAAGEDGRLLERDAELRAVEAALTDARAGRGRFLAIEGPAGIGKTTLLAETRSRAAAAGTTVLAARGSELERAFSYGVVRQLFEPALARPDAPERKRLLRGAAAHAGRLFDPAAADGDSADENAAFAALHGLYWLAANLAERGPLLLAVDDLQWADQPSLRFLAYLAPRLEGIPVLVAASTRPPGETDALLEELLADPAAEAVRPPALSAAGAAELVRDALAPEADDAFCAACHKATGGNPLLLRELVRTLGAEGVEPDAASVDAVARIAPETIARAVRVRLSHLPPEAASVARGGGGGAPRPRADRAQVAALTGLDRSAVAPVAAQLARVDLLRPAPPLAFVHPVLLNAVYEGMRPAECEAAHARAAEVLAEAGAPVEQVAAQLLRAPPGAGAGAVETLREAAGGALADGAPESGVAYLERALDELPGGDERAELLLELARAEFQLGRPSLVGHLREAARTAGDAGLRSRVRLALARALFWSTREEEAAAILEELIAERETDDELARLLEAELIGNSIRLPERSAAAFERLAALDVRAPDTQANRNLIALQAYVDALHGRNRESVVARSVEVLDAMLAGDTPLADWASVYILFYNLVWADAWEPAFRVLDAVVAEARREGAVFLFSGMSVVRVIAGFHRGTLEEAEADARAAYEALPHHRVLFMPQVHGWLAQTLVERGELDEAAEVLRSSELPETPIPDTFYAAPVVRARAALAAARGDAARALAHALSYGRAFLSTGLVNPAIGAWRSDAALAHLALGTREDALPLAQEEAELARAWGSARALGRALRALGLVEGGEAGIELLREAVSVLEGSGTQVEHARALADLGAALRRANRRAEARDLLRTALELAQRSGARLLAERVHEELVATGARPRRLVLSGVESLTPSERRVARMAAEGMANREIAQALFVTPRTVEMHLSNAFRKLAIGSRTQLPAALGAPHS